MSPSTSSYPTLRIGSTGQPVMLLQRALNAVPASQQPKLTEDAQFGPKTRSRVVEFQSQKKVAPDGVVGPITWAILEPIIRQIQGIIDQAFPASTTDSQRRARIVEVAKISFESWGWGESGPVTPNGSARIAAARGFGPAANGFRARQGGSSLAIIYSMAGLAGSQCLKISTDIEAVYQLDGRTHPERRTKLNQQDIGAWCGIFATYCYRAAGLPIAWPDMKSQNPAYWEILGPNAAVQPGDVGVYDPMLNHHFVVVAESAPGQRVHSIDGNVGNPSENTVTPWNSVISKRMYLRATLASKGGRFLRPKFAAMFK